MSNDLRQFCHLVQLVELFQSQRLESRLLFCGIQLQHTPELIVGSKKASAFSPCQVRRMRTRPYSIISLKLLIWETIGFRVVNTLLTILDSGGERTSDSAHDLSLEMEDGLFYHARISYHRTNITRRYDRNT